MTRKTVRNEELYGTKQVAEILEVPEWRVKNFSEGEAYGLPPSQKIGTGRGSRRIYGINDILRLGIANELVKAGFTPEAVGRAVREIPESMLTMWPETLHDVASEGKLQDIVEHHPLLVLWDGDWRVKKVSDVKKKLAEIFEYETDIARGIFILNFPSLLAAIHGSLSILQLSAEVKRLMKAKPKKKRI